MARYVAIAAPRLYISDVPDFHQESAQQRTITVVEDHVGPVPTGIVDASGVQLYRVPDRNPCGFTTPRA